MTKCSAGFKNKGVIDVSRIVDVPVSIPLFLLRLGSTTTRPILEKSSAVVLCERVGHTDVYKQMFISIPVMPSILLVF